jgi:hypothetical protein
VRSLGAGVGPDPDPFGVAANRVFCWPSQGLTHMDRTETAPYDAEWLAYWRWSRVFWIALVSLPMMATVMALDPPRWILPLIGVFAIGSSMAVALTYIKTMLLPCPRCHRLFFARQWRDPMAYSCRNCGLPKYAGSRWLPLKKRGARRAGRARRHSIHDGA